MTRAEFESIEEWYDLIDFCDEIGCRACQDIYDEAGYNNHVDDAASDYLRYYSWYELRDKLRDLPTDCEYYYKLDEFDWEDADYGDTFDNIKDEVLDFCNENELWDEGDTVEDEVYEEYEEDGEDEDSDCEEDFGEEELAVALKEFLTSSIITLS